LGHLNLGPNQWVRDYFSRVALAKLRERFAEELEAAELEAEERA